MNLTIAPGQLNIDLKLAKEDSLGHHILLDLYNCDEQSFLSNNKFKKVFREAVKMAGCTIVAEKFHNFSPCGLSGCLILSESSAQYHSWSENRYAAIDLFYCGKHVEIEKAIYHLLDYFKPTNIKIQEFSRGLIN